MPTTGTTPPPSLKANLVGVVYLVHAKDLSFLIIYTGRITFDGQPLDQCFRDSNEHKLGNGVTLIRRI